MKNGQVVYFKQVKLSTARKAPEFGFQGHGFGVFLGHVPPFQKEPPAEHLLRAMGAIGFVTFDDVAELLGSEQGQLCVKGFEKKYYGSLAIPVPDASAEPESTPDEKPGDQIVS